MAVGSKELAPVELDTPLSSHAAAAAGDPCHPFPFSFFSSTPAFSFFSPSVFSFFSP